ncbi:MAG: hypothetical protein ACHP7H_03280 [Hyphomicrobiales bacterium]
MKTYIALALAFAAYFGLLAYIAHMRHPPRDELLCCTGAEYQCPCLHTNVPPDCGVSHTSQGLPYVYCIPQGALDFEQSRAGFPSNGGDER